LDVNQQEDDEEEKDNVPDVLPESNINMGSPIPAPNFTAQTSEKKLPHDSSNVAHYSASFAILGQSPQRNAVLHRNNVDAKAPMIVTS
jgi:hypothetical protein